MKAVHLLRMLMKAVNIIVVTMMVCNLFCFSATRAAADDPYNPSFSARFPDNQVHGYNWTLGMPVTLTIDDPDNGVGIDHTDTQTAGPADWDPNMTWVRFNLDGFTLEPGQLISMTDGTITKTHTVTELAVTSVDPDADTVAGTAAPDSQINVGWICDNNGLNCAFRHAITNVSGDWLVDFHVVGAGDDEQTLFDIIPGTRSEASQPDDDGDSTTVQWFVPNPVIIANPGSDWVQGRDWPDGMLITLDIDDPDTAGAINYTATATFGPNPDNPGDPNDKLANFNLTGFDLKPGFILSMTDGTTVRTYTTTNLAITSIDLEADTISGIGLPGAEVQVCANIPNNCISRYVTPNAQGEWTVDYKTPGLRDDEQQTVDLMPGQDGWAAQRDENSNQTWADWRVANPNIEAAPDSNWVRAHEWPNEAELTMTIDDPSNGVGVDFTAHATMGPAPWNPNDLIADFDLNSFDLLVGQLITITDGTTQRTYQPTNVAVTDIDLDADTLSGIATPNFEVQVCANVPDNCYPRYVTADADGKWTVDYAHEGPRGDEKNTLDLQPGSDGGVSERDENGNQTQANWRVANPFIETDPTNNWVMAHDWPNGVEVTLTIDDNGTDREFKSTMGPAPWNPNDLIAEFNLNGFDILVGQLLTITDGTTERIYRPSNLAVTSFDLDADTISGIATPNADVRVCASVPDQCYPRYVTAGADGKWTVDYALEGTRDDEKNTLDLQPGNNGEASEKDDIGNVTQANWRVANPFIEANPGSKWLHGREWAKGTELTLTIDDPSDGTGDIDFTTTATMDQAPWNPGDPMDIVADFDISTFDLQAGHILKVTDGVTERTLVATNIAITGYNIAAGTISGIGEPGVEVHVCANMPGYCVSRYVTPDAQGRWSVDYSQPGSRDDEQELVTLAIDSNGWATQSDESGDQTWADWQVPNPYISDISDQITNENTATSPIAFTVADTNVPAANLTITAVSSNTALAPDDSITIGGSGANRTITLTPAANQTGTSTITVTVDDGSMSTSDTFVLTVNAVPVITEGASVEVTMSEDGSPTPFSLTLHATDADSADTLTWSIASLATHGTASASDGGASKSIGYTPTPGYHGNDSFVVQVEDGNGGIDTITVNVIITANSFEIFIPMIRR